MATRFTLLIKPTEGAPEWLKDYYREWSQSHEGDSGVDIPAASSVVVHVKGTVSTVHLGVSSAMRNNDTGELVSYILLPRSSISKTPLIMANSLGLIDAGYRGELMAKVRHVEVDAEEDYVVEERTRLFQVCAPDFSQLSIEVVQELDESTRGSGGFGSTGSDVATK